ncbi:hypothetical protein [Ureibacillus sinduriensis]|uniref:hypothetical protein n=1 Tax=Ureibacillus sinduriensis TaxID=561440 RepID=UPI00068CD7F6|nr:hypothetical protein [Ureibacillus sinduriensis]
MIKINKALFEEKLNEKLNKARIAKYEFIEINAGEFHREVGLYPSNNHRMATCSIVMKERMKTNDKIINSPNKGKGASLTIRYYL